MGFVAGFTMGLAVKAGGGTEEADTGTGTSVRGGIFETCKAFCAARSVKSYAFI
jgi:hypothetical protein